MAWCCWCGSIMVPKFSPRSRTRCRFRRSPGMTRARFSPGVPKTAKPGSFPSADWPVCVLEVLDCALVRLRLLARGEGAEIAPQAGLWVLLARVEPVLAVLEFADHGWPRSSSPHKKTPGDDPGVF